MPTARVSLQTSARKPRVSIRIRRTSPRQGPRAPMALVERMVTMASLVVMAYTDRLMRALEPLLQERYGKATPARRDDRYYVRLDAKSPSLDEIFEQVREGEVSQQFLERMFHMVDQQAANDLGNAVNSGRVVPVPLADVLPDAARMQSAWVERNTELIKLEERARHEVRAIIEAPIAEGVRVEEIRAQIQERMGVVRSRAELIARDQTLKLYGQVQNERQTQAGIEEYTWSTSDDERVRHRHAELEGTTQRWDSPPIVDPKTGRREHPGGDFQCRCAAIPILPTGEEAPISETRPSRRPPANDVPELPDPIVAERERLATERAAREEAARLAEERRVEAAAAAERERLRIEAERAAEVERLRALEAQRVEAARRAEERRVAAEAERRRLAEIPAQPLARSVSALPGITEGEQKTVFAALERAGIGQIGKGTTDVPQLYSFVLRTDVIPDGPRANGLYTPSRFGGAKVEVTRTKNFVKGASRGPTVLAHTTTYWAETIEESMATTAVHEFGHHLHMSVGVSHPIYDHVQRAFAKHVSDPGNTKIVQGAVTRYSNQDHQEFWAESYAATVMYPEWTRRVHPEIYAMVKEGLRLLKFKP